MTRKQRNWVARALIGIVLIANIQCATVFLTSPTLYAPGFELTGVCGEVMVRALGILFLMWCVPYIVAASDPMRRNVSLIEATVMQAIGLVGESLLMAGLPADHDALRATGMRFILFDGIGLLLLIAALMLVRRSTKRAVAAGQTPVA